MLKMAHLKKEQFGSNLGQKFKNYLLGEKGESFLFLLRRCLRDSVVLLFSVLFRLWNLGVIKTPKNGIQSTDRIMLSHRSPSHYTVQSVQHSSLHIFEFIQFFSNVFYRLIYHFWSVVGAQLVVGIDHFDYYSPVPAGDGSSTLFCHAGHLTTRIPLTLGEYTYTQLDLRPIQSTWTNMHWTLIWTLILILRQTTGST